VNSKTAIGIQDVLLYVTGQIENPSWRKAVEETRTTQPDLWEAEIVRAALRDEDGVDEPDETEDEVPEGVVKYYEKRSCGSGPPTNVPVLGMSIPLTMFRQAFAIGGKVADDSPILHLDIKPYGGLQGKWDFRDILGGAPKNPEEFPLAVEAREYLHQNGEEVRLDCPEELIPFGLGRLYFVDFNSVVRSTLPVLKFDTQSKRWWFNSTLQELFGVAPDQARKVIEPRFLPANENTLDAFDIAEIRTFIEQLPKHRKQRDKAEQFLTLLEKTNGEK
jgi:hypothetical protein